MLRAWSKGRVNPIFDYAPMATTSRSITVAVRGPLARRRRNFIAGSIGCRRAERYPDYNTPAERQRVLARLSEARAEYVRRSVQP